MRPRPDTCQKLILAALLAMGSALAFEPFTRAAAPQPAPQPTPQPAPSAVTLPEKLTLSQSQTHVIAFTLGSKATADQTLPASSSDPATLKIVRDAQVLKDNTLGYIRVQALKPGTATLNIGGATTNVTITSSSWRPEVDRWSASLAGPLRGAAVWGAFTLGVDINVPLDYSTTSKKITSVQVFAQPSSGKTDNKPDQPVGTASGIPALIAPRTQLPLLIDTQSLPAGPTFLYALVTLDSGQTITSPTLALQVVKPSDKTTLQGECETHTVPFGGPPNNKQANKPIVVANDPDASGGKFVGAYSGEPTWAPELDIPQSGLYQLMLTARGDLTAGAYPAVAIKFKQGNDTETASRIVDYRWHRIPVGRPVYLPAGKQKFGVAFLNDYYAAGYSDRNLYLDKYELTLTDDCAGASPAPASENASMMMSGAPTMTGSAPAMQPAPTMTGSAPAMQPAAMQAAPTMTGTSMTMTGRPSTGAENPMMSMGALKTADPGPTPNTPFSAQQWLADPTFMPRLAIALDTNLDGLSVAGNQWINASVYRLNKKPGALSAQPAPVVELIINGKTVMSQVSATPTFRVFTGWFTAGKNTVQLRATSGKDVAVTQVHTLTVTSTILQNPQKADFLRFDVENPAVWDLPARESVTHDEPFRNTLLFPTNKTATLTLPDSLQGDYDIYLEARGDNFKGNVETAVTLLTSDSPSTTQDAGRPLATVKINHWMSGVQVGKTPVSLPAGPKKLAIAFNNDAYEKGKGDRNFYMRSVYLIKATEPDTLGPVVTLKHPKNGDTLWSADVAVVECADDQDSHFVDLVIDGQRQGTSANYFESQRGNSLIPIPVARLSPGQHTLQIRANDRAGNVGLSKTISITVPESAPAQPTRYQNAVAFLNRMAFGPETHDLAQVLTTSPQEYLAEKLARPATTPAELEALARACIANPDPYDGGQTIRRALIQSFTADNPVRARFVLFTQNHFSTWVYKDEPQRKWAEHVAFHEAGVAPFSDLLLTSATSPAMLRYLDQVNSFSTRLNENYAREIMELHTLGVTAGYTQADVTALARVLNGWLATTDVSQNGRGFPAMGDFAYDPTLNAGSAERWFGLSLPEAAPKNRYDRIRFVMEALAAHPATARNISRKLLQHYAAQDPSPAFIDRLAKVFIATSGDMREVLTAMATDPEFTACALKPRLASPTDYAVRLSRVTDMEPGWSYSLQGYLARSGQGLFERVTPDGYPLDDISYADSNGMLQRWRLADEAQWQLFNTGTRTLTWDKPVDPVTWKQKVVDSYAILLLGRLLDEKSNQAALAILTEPNTKRDEQVRQLAIFIASTPEACMR
jgi:uncharacterized protein (DUF1800 family)